MRDIDEPVGQKMVNLISQHYIIPGKQPDHPRRSYGYPILDRNAISSPLIAAGAGDNLKNNKGQ